MEAVSAYRRNKAAYDRERRAAVAATGGYRQRRESLAFSAEELQAVDSSMRRYEVERLERQQSLSGVRGRVKSIWEELTK